MPGPVRASVFMDEAWMKSCARPGWRGDDLPVKDAAGGAHRGIYKGGTTMGGIANVVSGIQQGLQAMGGIFDAIGQFVPQLKQVGDMFKQVSGAFDAFAQMTAKMEAMNQERDQQNNAQVAPRAPVPAQVAPQAAAA
ncbi:MAG: hypothetical protein VKP57_03075 [Candidatus Sericytochromatia bacterium]|nr:hypothetical protein [Candidatus Sericytochromatia bacterium]